MSTTSIVVLVVFLAVFVQVWFTNFLHKVFITMLRTQYESTYLVSPTISLEHYIEREMLLAQYKEELRKFIRKIFINSLVTNGIIATIIIYNLG